MIISRSSPLRKAQYKAVGCTVMAWHFSTAVLYHKQGAKKAQRNMDKNWWAPEDEFVNLHAVIIHWTGSVSGRAGGTASWMKWKFDLLADKRRTLQTVGPVFLWMEPCCLKWCMHTFISASSSHVTTNLDKHAAKFRLAAAWGYFFRRS